MSGSEGLAHDRSPRNLTVCRSSDPTSRLELALCARTNSWSDCRRCLAGAADNDEHPNEARSRHRSPALPKRSCRVLTTMPAVNRFKEQTREDNIAMRKTCLPGSVKEALPRGLAWVEPGRSGRRPRLRGRRSRTRAVSKHARLARCPRPRHAVLRGANPGGLRRVGCWVSAALCGSTTPGAMPR